MRPGAGAVEKLEKRRRVEVEHLSSGELAVAHFVERQNFRLEALAVWAEPPSPVVDHHLIAVDGDHAGVETSLAVGRLERSPRPEPGLTPRLELLLEHPLAFQLTSVRKRRSLVKLELVVVETIERFGIAVSHRLNDVEHNLGLAVHIGLLTIRKAAEA